MPRKAKKVNYTYNTIQEFRDKLDWEGGVFGFAGYGCDPSEIKDPQLRKLWEEFLKYYELADKAKEKLTDYIEY